MATEWRCLICGWTDDDEYLLNEHIRDDHGEDQMGQCEPVEGDDGR